MYIHKIYKVNFRSRNISQSQLSSKTNNHENVEAFCFSILDLLSSVKYIFTFVCSCVEP